MRIRSAVLAGLATIGIAAVVVAQRRADRARLRALDRKLGDLVRAHALARVDGDNTVPYSDPTIAIVIAAFDEEDAIGAVLDALPRELSGHRVEPIVVVDGGTDDTAGVVQRAGYTALRHEVNRGQGDALVTGFALATERKAAIVVTMDADGQHQPDDLPKLLEPLLADEADYVQGSRYLGEYDDAGGARDAGIRFFTAVVNGASGAGITDCTNGFRAIRGESLAELRLDEPRFSAAELIIESARRGLRIREVPVHIQSRSHGDSKKPRRLAYPIGYLGAVVRTWRR
jgi:glycosyltransferase involved in cell wall biosynthesis